MTSLKERPNEENGRPSVSVITPTFNRASFLPRVWQSLKMQTEPNFEWIIIDDGSTDNTPEVVEQLQKDDNRIRYIRFTANKGVNFARARGAEESRASYLVFLDSDDTLYDSHTLAVMLSEIRSTPDDIGAVAFITVNEQGRPMAFLEQERMVLGYEEIVCEEKARGEFIMICKKDYLTAAPWSPYQGLECLHIWARARYFRTLFIGRPGRIYHSDAGDQLTGAASAIQRANSMAEGYLRLIKDHEEVWRKCCPKQLGRYLFYAGMYFALSGQIRRAIIYVCKSLKNKGPLLKILVLLTTCLIPTSVRRFMFTLKGKRRSSSGNRTK